MVNPHYMDVLETYYPNVKVNCYGDPYFYANLNWTGGDALPDQATLDASRLDLIKLQMWKKIQAERDRRKGNGVFVSNKWFHTDDASRIQQLGLLMMGANIPAGIMWKTLDGSFIEMTPTLANQIFSASASQDVQIFSVAEYHRAQMQASSDPANYDYSGGWPATLGE